MFTGIPEKRKRSAIPAIVLLSLALIGAAMATGDRANGAEETIALDTLLSEGLRNNPEVLAARARAEAAGYRIPQAKSLPDPMFMFGYQNEGFKRFTVGEEPDAMGMFSLSQMFYFPGKRTLKGEMASRDAESAVAMYHAIRLRAASRIKELYFDLFLAYKNLDILKSRTALFSRIEDAASARYASGMGMQQEVVMAQTEKYMIMEKEEMQEQKIQALTGMLNAAAGRETTSLLGRPAPPVYTPDERTLEEILAAASEHSPELQSKRKMLEGAKSKVRMAKKEYFPDITLSAGYFPKTQGMLDMWSLTATVNLPIFSGSKQKQAVMEANADLTGAGRDLEATRLMIASTIKENYAMAQSAGKLMKLYKDGLIPKVSQDVELSFSGYATGKIEALTVISRIKNLLDFDLLYWQQFVEREKAIARINALTGSE